MNRRITRLLTKKARLERALDRVESDLAWQRRNDEPETVEPLRGPLIWSEPDEHGIVSATVTLPIPAGGMVIPPGGVALDWAEKYRRPMDQAPSLLVDEYDDDADVDTSDRA